MKRMKKILSVLLALVMLFSVTAGMHITSQAAVLPSSGWCGDGVKFKFNGKKLTVYGKGEIQAVAFEGQKAIKQVVIKKGVTGIGYYAFTGCSNIKSVKLSKSIKYINVLSFRPYSDGQIIKNVYYGGSKADAKKIREYEGGPKVKLKDIFPNAKIHYNS